MVFSFCFPKKPTLFNGASRKSETKSAKPKQIERHEKNVEKNPNGVMLADNSTNENVKKTKSKRNENK